MKTKLYVGCKAGSKEVFRTTEIPTHESHGGKYEACIGPFRTIRAAKWMAHPVRGMFNPHCVTVGDAERLAKMYAVEYDAKTQTWPDP